MKTTAFLFLPNFHSCFSNSIETCYMTVFYFSIGTSFKLTLGLCLQVPPAHATLFCPFAGSLCSRQPNCHLFGAADRSLPSLAAVAGHMSWQGVVQLRGCQVVCCEGQCSRQTVLSTVWSIARGEGQDNVLFQKMSIPLPQWFLIWTTPIPHPPEENTSFGFILSF